ncbi:MAG: hypothetical protein JOZ77_07075 [Candidatus Eremiobacteraeota bacterium]|nr:hypothetical protein [Candidatus Eremiobacteraeota bacterium]
MELRPLDLGGIFERAFALFARHFVAFVGIVAAAALPFSALQYVVLLGGQKQLDATLNVLQHPQRIGAERVPTLFDSPMSLAIVVATALLGYYVLGFAVAAVAVGVGRLYRGTAVGFRSSYTAVLERWKSILAVVGIAVLALVAAYTATIAVVALPLLAVATLASRWFPSVIPLALVAAVVIITIALVLILVTTACAICAIVVEGDSAALSLRVSLRRIFARREIGRALFCRVAVGAIGLAAATLADTVAVLGLSRWPAGYGAIDALQRIVVVPYLALVFAVYYFDLRIRHEAFDVEAALERGSEEPIYAPTAYLSGEERALVKRFMERRDSLSPFRRREIAAQLAAPARKRVPADLQGLDDEPLLERL